MYQLCTSRKILRLKNDMILAHLFVKLLDQETVKGPFQLTYQVKLLPITTCITTQGSGLQVAVLLCLYVMEMGSGHCKLATSFDVER